MYDIGAIDSGRRAHMTPDSSVSDGALGLPNDPTLTAAGGRGARILAQGDARGGATIRP
jgi:hypothetical protein